jgi:hypothetical protein
VQDGAVLLSDLYVEDSQLTHLSPSRFIPAPHILVQPVPVLNDQPALHTQVVLAALPTAPLVFMLSGHGMQLAVLPGRAL